MGNYQARSYQWLAAIAVSAFVWWRTSVIDGPFLFHDEFGYVAVSRWLAGPQTPELFGPMYHPGYGLFLTPLAALTRDPSAFHAWATAINAATVGLILLATVGLGARLGVAVVPRLIASIVACTTSALVLFAGMLLAEVLLTLAVVTCVLSLWQLLEQPSNTSAVATGLSVAATYLIHPRSIVLAIALVIVLGVSSVTNGVKRSHIVALATAVLGYVASYGLITLTAGEIYADVTETDTSFLITNAFDDPTLLVKAIAGTAWYLTASTFGLAVWGGVGAVRMAARRDGPQSMVGLFVCLGVSGSLATSGIFTAGILINAAQTRPDVITYGRYVEQWVPVLMIFGVAELVRPWTAISATRDRWFVAAIGLTAATLVAGPLVFSTFGPGTRSGPTAISNSSALGWFWFQTGNLDLTQWGWVAVPLVLTLSAAGRFRYWVPLAAVFVWAQLAIGSTVNDWARPAAESWEQRGRIEGAAIPSPYVYTPDSDPLAIYGLQYWQPDLDVDVSITPED